MSTPAVDSAIDSRSLGVTARSRRVREARIRSRASTSVSGSVPPSAETTFLAVSPTVFSASQERLAPTLPDGPPPSWKRTRARACAPCGCRRGMRPVSPSPKRSTPAARSTTKTRSPGPWNARSAVASQRCHCPSRSRRRTRIVPGSSRTRPGAPSSIVSPGSGSHSSSCFPSGSERSVSRAACRATATLGTTSRSRGGAVKVAASVVTWMLCTDTPSGSGGASGSQSAGTTKRITPERRNPPVPSSTVRERVPPVVER